MRYPLDFIDAAASDDEPVKGVLQGHLRDWHDEIDRLRMALRLLRSDLAHATRQIDDELGYTPASLLLNDGKGAA